MYVKAYIMAYSVLLSQLLVHEVHVLNWPYACWDRQQRCFISQSSALWHHVVDVVGYHCYRVLSLHLMARVIQAPLRLAGLLIWYGLLSSARLFWMKDGWHSCLGRAQAGCPWYLGWKRLGLAWLPGWLS